MKDLHSHTNPNPDLIPISAFSVYAYSKHRINRKLTYNECCLLIQSYPSVGFDQRGCKVWNVKHILDDAIERTPEFLLARINHHAMDQSDISYVTCHLSPFDENSFAFALEPFCIVSGFIRGNILTYFDEGESIVSYLAYEIDWPQRYPHIRIQTISTEKPSTLHPLLVKEL